MKIFLPFALSCLITVGCSKSKPPNPNPEAVLSELSHLATLKCEFSVVACMEHNDPLRGTDKCLTRTTGSSLLSFDLTKATHRQEGNTLTFILPEIEVLSPKLDSEWEKIKEHRSGLTTETEYHRWRDEEERKAQGKVEEMSRDAALVKMAEEQAAVLIKSFYATQCPELIVVVRSKELN